MGMINCKYCGERISDTNRNCPFCGTSLSYGSAIVKCRCGFKFNKRHHEHCPNCGEPSILL